MRCSIVGLTVILSLGLCVPLTAQQTEQVPRIGYLSTSAPEIFRVDVFRQALRDLGWVEGQNLIIHYRSADGQFARLPALAAELVGLKVDVIVAAATVPALAAKRATQQTGPKDCLHQCGNKRLCRLVITPSISTLDSHTLEAAFCFYAA